MPDLLAEIAEAADALTDPRHHAEPRWGWTATGNRKALKPHETTVPGLIQQLRALAEPGADGGQGGRGGPESVPVAIDAVSLLGSITTGSAMRVAAAVKGGYRIEARTGPEDCIRGLVGVAPRLPFSRTRVDPYLCPGCVGRTDREFWQPCHHCQPTTQGELASELRSWRWQAEIIAGWRTPPRELPAPCPACDAKGTLLAYADPDNPQAKCVGCGQQWSQEPRASEGAIGVLAEHVISYGRRTEADRRLMRTRAVADRHRRAGRTAA